MKPVGDADGYILLKKNPGVTSFEALSLVKKALGTGRVGHAGTLDKFAEGLLIVLVGRATRLVQWFSGSDKLYEGVILFGAETDTLDPEGRIVAEAPPPTHAVLTQCVPRFLGPQLQTPPEYSAVHVDGHRAHELARSGVVPEMKPRPVWIHELDLLAYDPPLARIRVRCSKGTYIRSLARDIALAAASRAHLTALNRLEIAGFKVADSVDPAGADDPLAALRAALKPIGLSAFKALGSSCFQADDRGVADLVNGRGIDADRFLLLDEGTQENAPAAVFAEDGHFVALVEKTADAWRYGLVYDRR